MKRKWILAAVTAAVLSTPVSAQMDPGMMGGYGPGRGYSTGPGMMGGYGYGGLGDMKLSGEQQEKISEIQQDVSRKQWDLMGKVHEQRFHMYQFGPGIADKKAREAYQAMSAIHQAMFELSLDARKRIKAVFTKDQLEQLRRNWRSS